MPASERAANPFGAEPPVNAGDQGGSMAQNTGPGPPAGPKSE